MAMLAAKFASRSEHGLALSAQTVSMEWPLMRRPRMRQNNVATSPTAVREYEYLTRQLPRSAEMQSNLGVALYFDHQWERAIAVFRKAIALNPNLLAPHLFTGLAWYQLAKPDAAVSELETAVRLHASDVIAHTWLGYAYVAQSRYEVQRQRI